MRPSNRLLVVLSGVHAALFLLSYALLTSAPGPRAPDAELLEFYASSERFRLILVGLFVMPFAGISFLWVSSALRAHFLAAGEQHAFAAGLQHASGILYVALFFAAAAASSVVAVGVEYSDGSADPMLARQFPEFGRTLLLVFAMRMAAMYMFTTSRLAHLTSALPRWFVIVGVSAGIFLALNPFLDRALVLIFPTWLILLAVLLRPWTR